MPDMLECNICTTPTMYRHLGGISCKACADFYRRSLMARRVYSCRKGDGKCTIDPKYRQICRGCRFERCKRIGLRMIVMPKKDADSHTMKIPDYTVLQRICNEYSSSVNRRKENERKLIATKLRGNVRTAVGQEELQLCSRSFLKKYLRLFNDDSMQFASAAFPDFAALFFQEQQLIMEKSSALLYIAQMLSNTFMRFKSICGPITLKFFIERATRVVGPILTKSNFTPTEYAAVFALLLWQIDPSQPLPERLITLIFTIRRRIYVDLSMYYRQELGYRLYAIAFANNNSNGKIMM